MQTLLKGFRVGFWLSEKKMKKLNFMIFVDMCRKRGMEMFQLDLSRPLEEQGPLDVIIHKLNDLLLEADQNHTEALLALQSFQEYIEAHPETIVLDPLPAIRTLLDRFKSYQLILRIKECLAVNTSTEEVLGLEPVHPQCLWKLPTGASFVFVCGGISKTKRRRAQWGGGRARPKQYVIEEGTDDMISCPPFLVIRSQYGTDTLGHLQRHGITFPFICKTRVAHGTDSHKMAIIFNEEGLKDIKPPCVVQNFINHNAVLYKVFVVGEAYTVVERPSIRNFPSGPTERKAILFHSHDVSKPECTSDLTSRDHAEGISRVLRDDIIREISRALRRALGVSLFGVDIIISNQTGQHAIIDVNSFPGYEGVTKFYDDLLNHLTNALKERASGKAVDKQSPAVATATCGKPCVLLGKEANSWLLEASVDIKSPGTHQGLGCNAEVPPNFQPQCMSAIPSKASSL